MTRDCRRLAEIVEVGRHDIDRATAPGTAKAYRDAAPLYPKVAGRLRLAAGSSEIRRTAEEYARTVEAMGPSVTAYADALDSGDAEREAATRRELDTAARRERVASRRLEDQCHGRILLF